MDGYVVYRNDELYHHGIKGQKWGVRRFQYEDGSLTPAGEERYLKGAFDRAKQKISDTIDKIKNYKLSDKQKAILKGVAITAAVVGTAAVAYNFIDSGHYDVVKDAALRKLGMKDSTKAVDKPIKPIKGVRTLDHKEEWYESLNEVNVGYGFTENSVRNCFSCALASHMRSQGYDVTAQSNVKYSAKMSEVIPKMYSNAKVDYYNASYFGRSQASAKKLMRAKYGDNASGICTVAWKTGGGHTFNWQIRNGSVTFFDCQNPNGRNPNEIWSCLNMKRSPITSVVSMSRLDNADLNVNNIHKYVNVSDNPFAGDKEMENIMGRIAKGETPRVLYG